jgi:hypothetical protein
VGADESPLEQLAGFVLLLLGAVFFVQVMRGTERQWLRSKFVGG